MLLGNRLYKRFPDPNELEARCDPNHDNPVQLQDLEESLEQLKSDNILLDEENKTLQQYWLAFQHPQSLKVGQATVDASSPASTVNELNEEPSDLSGDTNMLGVQPGGKKGKGRSRRRSSTQKDVVMQVDWKLEVAGHELERLKAEKDEEVKGMEKSTETVRAGMEEAELRIQETRKDMYEFKRDIVGDRTIAAEKILKYLDERLKLKEAYVAKLRMKSLAHKGQISKYEHQLKQREDMGEVLHAIDFDQLKIENQQFLERIEGKNNELVKLKLTTGKTVQTMNGLTEKLNKFSQEQAWLRKEIKQREEHLEKLKEDISQVHQEKEAAQRKNTQLKLQHEAVKVPKVEDYIQQKAEQYELEKAAANWRRKVEIAEGQKKIVLQQSKRANSANF